MSAPPKIHWTGYVLHKVNPLRSDHINEVTCKKCLVQIDRKEKRKSRITKFGLSRRTLENKISNYLCHKLENAKDKYVAFMNYRLSTWDKKVAANIDAPNIATFDNLTLANRFFEDSTEKENVFFVLLSDVKKNGTDKYLLQTS